MTESKYHRHPCFDEEECDRVNTLFTLKPLGAQSVLTYATVNGLLVGWDLRSPKNAWQLKNDPKHGTYELFF